MSAVVTNINDLEFVWRAADDGFSAGIDFKTWLANSVIQLRATVAEQARALDEARDRIYDLKDVIDGVITTAAYTAGNFMITPRMYDELQQALDDEGWRIAWLSAHPAEAQNAA